MKLAVALGGACLTLLAFAGPAQADFAVNNTGDGSDLVLNGTCEVTMGMADCTLRAAIDEANNTPAPDTITFTTITPHNQTATLTIIQPTVIDGNGNGTTVADTVIQGNDTFRLFVVNGAAVTFRDLLLQDGGVNNPGGQGGAAIDTSNDLMLDNVTVRSNTITGTGSGLGAGILSDNIPTRTVTLIGSSISDNTISSGGNNSGAGIFSQGPLNVTDSTVSGNMITGGTSISGAGIKVASDLDIQRSTISGNLLNTGASVPTTGAGIHAFANVGPKTITNSTISGNTASDGGNDRGAGAAIDDDATITSSTFANNEATGGPDNGADLVAAGGTVTVKDTILASGANACDLSTGGALASAGNSIDVGTSCGFGAANGNQQNTDSMLAGLSLVPPGTTETHALMPGSPAIDAGALTGLATDQRGVPRPQGTRCDIGAFEMIAANDSPSCVGPAPAIIPPVLTPTPAPSATPVPAKKKCKKKKVKKGIAGASKKCKRKKK